MQLLGFIRFEGVLFLLVVYVKSHVEHLQVAQLVEQLLDGRGRHPVRHQVEVGQLGEAKQGWLRPFTDEVGGEVEVGQGRERGQRGDSLVGQVVFGKRQFCDVLECCQIDHAVIA